MAEGNLSEISPRHDATFTPAAKRRQAAFAVSMALAGLAVTILCLVPLFVREADPRSLFVTTPQEDFFFDMIGWIGGAWLACWVASLCNWRQLSFFGQWLGICILCINQVVLLGVWKTLSGYDNFWSSGIVLTPVLLQIYFLGYFLGFFTMPALTLSGNKTLTGLGTLAVLLPWLLGRESIVTGTQLLFGAFS
jgi:hypothetical protein